MGFSDLYKSDKSALQWRLIVFMAWSDVRARCRRSVLSPLWITITTALGVVRMGSGFSDLYKSALQWRLIVFMAWSDTRGRYRRSVLGPLWITITTAVGVVGMGFIWSSLFKIDEAEYIPMLTSGLIVWIFISSSIIEATSVFLQYAGAIRNLDLPRAIFPAQAILRQLITFAHNIPLFFIVLLIIRRPLPVTAFMALPGLLLDIANLYWIGLLLGMLGARFRDLAYIVGTVMPLLMFFTPVLYQANALPFNKTFMMLNPFGDMIEIVRYPLLGTPVPPLYYVVTFGFLLIGGALALTLYNAKRDRIAYWI